MAALDYARLRERLSRSRLLFVAHRRRSSTRASRRSATRSARPSFGERWVGGARPERFEHVFASIQSLSSADLGDLAPDHFDVVIVDEFHHAAAPSYRACSITSGRSSCSGSPPRPERSDGLPILHWFDDRIAAELRLWDAIDQQRLAPFAYFGIHDGLDLRGVPWRRGHGYDTDALSAVYTGNDAWARLVVQEVVRARRCRDRCGRSASASASTTPASWRATSPRHGIAAVAVWGDSPTAEREAALRDLSEGRVQVVFSVDLFNEGVDVPTVDTLLMLRPTESPTLFLQQLGRGLRKTPGKPFCTVLDFVGTHRREFRFDRRCRALLGGTRREVERAVEQQFPFLPAGCHMELDETASEIVLRSLREAIPTRWPAKVEELRRFAANVRDLACRLPRGGGLDLDDVYAGSKSWSDLSEAAGAPCSRPAPTRQRSGGRSAGCCTSTTRSGSAPTGVLIGSRPRRSCDPHRTRASADPNARRRPRRPGAHARRRPCRTGSPSLWRTRRCAPSSWSSSRCCERGSTTSTPIWLASRRAAPGPRALQPPRDPRRVRRRRRGAKIAAWQTGVYEAKRAKAESARLHAGQEQRRLLTDDPLPRLRHQPHAHPLGEPVDHAGGQPDGPPLPEPRARGRAILLFSRLRADDRAFWFLGPATLGGRRGQVGPATPRLAGQHSAGGRRRESPLLLGLRQLTRSQLREPRCLGDVGIQSAVRDESNAIGRPESRPCRTRR